MKPAPPPSPATLLTSAAVRAIDDAAAARGLPGRILMERAGRAVAAAAAARALPGASALVLCGTGNNGGDGFVAARVLAGRGFDVVVALASRRDALRGDAALAAADWTGKVEDAAAADPSAAAIIVDALFGVGLTRDLDDGLRAIVARVNASGRPVVAVDIPSGIDANTGAIRGAAIQATATVTFVARKPGHLLLPGRLHAGEVSVADIGVGIDAASVLTAPIRANGPALWRGAIPWPATDTHKFERGHVAVVSGPIGSTGAARLAARGALRAGAGLVTVASPPGALAVNAAQLTAIMVRVVDGPAGLAALLDDARINALVIGPGAGVGPATRNVVMTAARARRALVLDADALTSFADDPAALSATIVSAQPGVVVLTPHEGEFQRLFNVVKDVVDAESKLERAKAAARLTGAIVVLKGPDTVVAAPDGRSAINENGTPFLATAGSGDVLAGFVAGLLAQGMKGFEAACAAVWLHGAAGEALGPGLIAEDLPEALPAVLKRMRG